MLHLSARSIRCKPLSQSQQSNHRCNLYAKSDKKVVQCDLFPRVVCPRDPSSLCPTPPQDPFRKVAKLWLVDVIVINACFVRPFDAKQGRTQGMAYGTLGGCVLRVGVCCCFLLTVNTKVVVRFYACLAMEASRSLW